MSSKQNSGGASGGKVEFATLLIASCNHGEGVKLLSLYTAIGGPKMDEKLSGRYTSLLREYLLSCSLSMRFLEATLFVFRRPAAEGESFFSFFLLFE